MLRATRKEISAARDISIVQAARRPTENSSSPFYKTGNTKLDVALSYIEPETYEEMDEWHPIITESARKKMDWVERLYTGFCAVAMDDQEDFELFPIARKVASSFIRYLGNNARKVCPF